VRASSSDAPHLPAHVLDTDPDTYWSAAPAARDGWLEFELPREIEFDTLELGEAVAHGQTVADYRVEHWSRGAWRPLCWGTTIGHKKLARMDPVRARRLRLMLEFGYGTPRLARVAAWRGPDRRYGPGHDER
jgi:alpha-L-fucosidase